RRSLPAITGLALTASLLAGTPALADGPPAPHGAEASTFTIGDTANFFECFDHPYAYDLDIPDEATYHAATVTIQNPKGQTVGYDYITQLDEPTVGTGTVELCGTRRDMVPGTYTALVEVKWQVYDDDSGEYELRSTF